MRKVRYIPTDSMCYDDITVGKVYDVILDLDDYYILIDNDKGERDFFFIYSIGGILEFPDVTNEYRNEIIDGILT